MPSGQAVTEAADPCQPRQSARFGRPARLTRSAEFSRVFADATRYADRYFTVLACPNAAATSTEPGARLGLAISKRAAPLAVDRNRIKRLVREAFRTHRSRLPNVDLVVMCRRAAADASNGALRSAISARLMRLSR